MDDALRELARGAGIEVDWIDAAGRPQQVSVESLRLVLGALGYPSESRGDISDSVARLRGTEGERTFITANVDEPIDIGGSILPPICDAGYHTVGAKGREITVAVAPRRCFTIEDEAPGKRAYGIALQLYSLRRTDDDGIGDTASLQALVTAAAREGADAVALSPTHSMFAADPNHYAPYSPSSRLFLNPLYADPAMVLGDQRVATFRDLQHSHLDLVDWPRVARAKYALLRRLYDDFAAHEMTDGANAMAADFRAFIKDGCARLREHALFEALHAHWFGGAAKVWSWSEWPADWRMPSSYKAVGFAEEQANAVQFHMFVQWIAARAFQAVQQHARECGMAIGLISDLAVGMSPGGSHAWSRQQDLLIGLNVGAPPDLYNTRGQDWGLVGFSPRGLVANGFEPFIATLRAGMRYAGGVRIDHAMGLARLWVVPQGASPAEGAYLSYPLDDMLRLIALESQRNRAIVIAEDLGTVAPEFRERLSNVGISGMDVLWFERKGRAFRPPTQWRRDGVAMTTTHDLPTVAGWWSGADIATRAELGFADEKKEKRARTKDRTALWRAFRRSRAAKSDEPAPADTSPVVNAAIAHIAKSADSLALIPIEDLLGVQEQPNLPGTTTEHPNWRRRLGKPAAEVLTDPVTRARMKTLRDRR